MHQKLNEALKLLDISALTLQDNNGTVVRHISADEHAKALFNYLDLAGFLNPELFEKAINYLSIGKPFCCPNETLIQHLRNVYKSFLSARFF